ncbi:hypothetical protein [Streptomyces sp. NPDC088789]|uniref:hypothetical protein n=1 Tax=Streptomyces sp. NPDC088789 TaxID=3365899 RepID=UPI00380020E7
MSVLVTDTSGRILLQSVDYRDACLRLTHGLAVHWAEPADLPTYMEPGNARRALAALGARINGTGTVLLEDGRPTAPSVLDRLEVLRTARRPQRWPWHTTAVPAGLPLTQCWGWLFAPDGRALVLIGRDTGSACLTGGTLAPGDAGDPAVALRRESARGSPCGDRRADRSRPPPR